MFAPAPARSPTYPSAHWPQSLRDAARIGVLALLYFATAKASLLLAIPPGYATPVWPPSGIALAALLLFGNRLWPGIWIGAAAVNFTVQSSLLTAVMLGTGNTLEALAGAWLMRRFVGEGRTFERAQDVLRFVAIAALAATIAATVALFPLWVMQPLGIPEALWNWLTWWQGDMTGIIIVTPLILSWGLRNASEWTVARRLEWVCLAFLVVAASAMVFTGTAPAIHMPAGATAGTAPLHLTFITVPLVVWAAFRFGQREVTVAIAAVCAIALWNTAGGRGPFAFGSMNASLLLLLAFTATLAATGLTLVAVLAERGHAMAALRKALDDVREQSITDPLTGLSNRWYLREILPREMMRAMRNRKSVAAIMIDIDYFKSINDAYGHPAGDAVLAAMGATLKDHIRASDIACRYGGEEFLLILPEASVEGAEAKAEEIRLAVKSLQLMLENRPVSITASFGVALFPDHASGMNALVRVADEALYQAKAAGRDRVVLSEHQSRPPRSLKEMSLLFR